MDWVFIVYRIAYAILWIGMWYLAYKTLVRGQETLGELSIGSWYAEREDRCSVWINAFLAATLFPPVIFDWFQSLWMILYVVVVVAVFLALWMYAKSIAPGAVEVEKEQVACRQEPQPQL